MAGPPLPRPDYVSLPDPTASTSASVDGQAVPPPPPPFPSEDAAAEEEPEPAKTGSKRTRGKGKGKAAAAAAEKSSKAAKTEGTKSAAGANRILTVLKEEDLRMPTLPTVEELEKFLVQKQKEEMLSELV